MKKFYRVFLSTYNPNKFKINLDNNNSFFNIQKIIILNNLLINRDEINEKLKQIYGQNIFLIKGEDIEEALKNISFLKKIEVKKKYPDTIIIKIFETKPLAILFKNKIKYLLDSSSNLIEIKKKNNFIELPSIIGENAEKNFINFLEQLTANKFPTSNIKNFLYYQIGRWDLELLDNRILKLPYNVSNRIIKKSIELLNRKDFQIYKIIDLRVDGKVIVE